MRMSSSSHLWKRAVPLGLAALTALAAPAAAWDANGHRVVARIAWDTMQPRTRERAVALLLGAPPDADLANLLPADGRPLGERQRELFELASTWPDLVRDAGHAARKAKYDHPAWHYVDWYWDLITDGPQQGTPRDRLDLAAAPGTPAENIVERLRTLVPRLGAANVEKADQAVDLAWVLHLAGDIGMPLHCSSRVTREEPQGDKGATLFKLDTAHGTLHWYWDSILTNAIPKQAGEADEAYVGRLAALLVSRNPYSARALRLDLGHYEAWCNDGYDLAKTVVYPPYLVREKLPPSYYQDLALGIAQPAMALAGYRLAALLDWMLGVRAGGD
jgi:hypothetical protein